MSPIVAAREGHTQRDPPDIIDPENVALWKGGVHSAPQCWIITSGESKGQSALGVHQQFEEKERLLLGASTGSRLNGAPDNSPNHDAAPLPLLQLHLLRLRRR